MLNLTLDNLKIDNGSSKTYAVLTTPAGEKIRIFFIDAKHKHPQIRIGIDCDKAIKINRSETDSRGYYERD